MERKNVLNSNTFYRIIFFSKKRTTKFFDRFSKNKMIIGAKTKKDHRHFTGHPSVVGAELAALLVRRPVARVAEALVTVATLVRLFFGLKNAYLINNIDFFNGNFTIYFNYEYIKS